MEREDAVEVFERERLGLVRLAHAITGSNALAEDIVQDAYLRWRGRTDVVSPGAYLRTVVVNLSRSGDDRIVWIVQQSGGGDADADPRFAPVDHAIVWSSTSPEGRRAAVAVFGDLQQLAWILEDGEEPWGVQLIDARGRLVTTHHLAGLPGS